jgi:chromosome segregation ATPase
MIIGLRQYVRTIAEQTLRFSQMTARVQKQIADDQEQFVAANTQLRNLAIQRTQLVRNTEETRNRVATQNQKDKDFVKQREVQLAELKDELTRIKQEVNELLARQKITEAALFAIQREVGLTLEDIYKLEDDLRRIERERYGMK